MKLVYSLALLASAGTAVAASGGYSFTEELQHDAGSLWTRATTHPFTAAIASGEMDEVTMSRYLIQDHKFLDSFVVLLASMIANAPSLEDRIPGAQFLALITSKENTYFERSFEALGVPNVARQLAPHDVTADFIALMRSAAASGSVANMLAVLVVCEWSYRTWGEVAAATRAAGLPFWLGEWIDLHSGEYFTEVVGYLRGMLDRIGKDLTDEEKHRVRQTFLRAVNLEAQFWDMAWADGVDVARAADVRAQQARTKRAEAAEVAEDEEEEL